MKDHRPIIRPPKRSVRERWFLPAKSPFCGIPLAVLTALNKCSPSEHRVAVWIIADWWWPGGLTRELNVARLARRCEMTRPNTARALAGLAKRGIFDVRPGGRGNAGSISLVPLIELGRKIASGEDSGRVSSPPTAREKTQSESPKTQSESSSRLSGEPGVGTSEPFSSDSSRRASEVGAKVFDLSTARANGQDKAAEQRLRVAAIQDQLRPFIDKEQAP